MRRNVLAAKNRIPIRGHSAALTPMTTKTGTTATTHDVVAAIAPKANCAMMKAHNAFDVAIGRVEPGTVNEGTETMLYPLNQQLP